MPFKDDIRHLAHSKLDFDVAAMWNLGAAI